MTETLPPEFECAFTGRWWFPPQTITFSLSDGEYTVEFDPKVDTRDTLVSKLRDAIANNRFTGRIDGEPEHVTLDAVRHD